jgi:streptomycin 6-kinase
MLTAADIPPNLTWLTTVEGGPAWLASLPALAQACAERWQLRLGTPFPASFVSLAVPAEAPDGAVVLKIQFPERESAREADALRAWGGAGAIQLLDWGALAARGAAQVAVSSAARHRSRGARSGAAA